MSKIFIVFMYSTSTGVCHWPVLGQTNQVNIWKIISLDTHLQFIISSVCKFLMWSHPITFTTFPCYLILSHFPPSHVISSYHASHLLMWSHPITLPTFSCDLILSRFPPSHVISSYHASHLLMWSHPITLPTKSLHVYHACNMTNSSSLFLSP